jgi:hypothetical protein
MSLGGCMIGLRCQIDFVRNQQREVGIGDFNV